MAEQHHKSEPATPQALRHLKGDWLAAAGFGTDIPVRVAVEPGQLIIRVVTQ